MKVQPFPQPLLPQLHVQRTLSKASPVIYSVIVSFFPLFALLIKNAIPANGGSGLSGVKELELNTMNYFGVMNLEISCVRGWCNQVIYERCTSLQLYSS